MAEFTVARESFKRARRKAFWNALLAALTGRPNRLLAWDDVKDKLRIGGQIYRGVQAVSVDKIIGSVNRYRDFDRAFLPAQEFTAERWRGISRAFYREEHLPPVSLYKVGAAYFVLDGNHRVSVAREQGKEFIDAEVIEAETRVPVDADLDAHDLEIKGEYADFLERTHLDELRPDARLEFTIAGGYQRVLEHIAVHRYYMGQEQSRFIAEEEAVTDWYDHIYLPVVAVLREQHSLKEFPRRTETDLYLWIIEHLHFLREENQQATPAEAAEHFAEHHTGNLLTRAFKLISQLWVAAEGAGQADAHVDFLAATGLHRLRPGQQVRCAAPGSYQRLLEHIAIHRHFMGQEQQRFISEAEAVTDWYDQVYTPIAAVIEEQQLRAAFPNLETADLYLWITDLFPDPQRPAAEVAESFAARYTPHAIKRAIALLQELRATGGPPQAVEDAADFLAHTGLDALRSEHGIRVTTPGGYQRLLEHIAAHRYFMGLEQQRYIPEDEAVSDWYDRSYLPVARAIAEQHVLQAFPRRTAADLYLWLMEYRHLLPGDASAASPAATVVAVADREGGPALKQAVALVQQVAQQSAKDTA